jgi:hypothetical protein
MMRKIDTLIVLALLIAAGTLAAGFLLSPARANFALSVLAPVLIWGLGRYFKLTWTTLTAFALFVLLALTGVIVNIDLTLAVVAIVAALALLDLDAFRSRLAKHERIDDEDKLINHHLTRLSIICALSLLLYGATFLIDIDLDVWSALLLAFVLFFGLSRAVTYLRRESD